MAKKRRVSAELPVSFSVSFLDSCDRGGGGAGPHHICRHLGVAHVPEISFPGSFLDLGVTFPNPWCLSYGATALWARSIS